MRSEQTGVQGDGFEVAAERLPDADCRRQPTGVPQAGDRARRPERQRPAVRHDVDDARLRPVESQPGEHRRQRGMQVGDDHRHAVERIGIDQDAVVRRFLGVDAMGADLLRGVARLHQVTVVGGVGWQSIGQRDDHRVAAGAEAELEGRDVEEHDIADPRITDHRRIRDSGGGRALDVDHEFDRTRPRPAD